MTAITYRDLKPGEEITISCREYLPFNKTVMRRASEHSPNNDILDSQLGMLYEDRQSWLQRRWNFKCTCDMCTAPKETREASDARRKMIQTSKEDSRALAKQARFSDAISFHEKIIDMIQKEGLFSFLSEHYELMARLYYVLKDMKNAEKYGKMALENLEEFGGPDIYESMKNVEKLYIIYRILSEL
jgi:tetratricopeptide (TPR) repeat protein